MTRKLLRSHYDYTIDTKTFDKNYINFSKDTSSMEYSTEKYLKTKKNHFKNLKREYVRKVIYDSNKKLIKK